MPFVKQGNAPSSPLVPVVGAQTQQANRKNEEQPSYAPMLTVTSIVRPRKSKKRLPALVILVILVVVFTGGGITYGLPALTSAIAGRHTSSITNRPPAKLVVGKKKDEAQSILSAQTGIMQVNIQLPGVDGVTLPTDASLIAIVVNSARG